MGYSGVPERVLWSFLRAKRTFKGCFDVVDVMSRAKRDTKGCHYHVTHRCHEKQKVMDPERG